MEEIKINKRKWDQFLAEIESETDTISGYATKIDDEAVLGLAGTTDSLAYKIHELEKHFHNPEQVWGLTSNDMARKSVAPIVVTGGNGAWGTELLLTDGTIIEAGSAVKKFDLGRLAVTTSGTANRITLLEFYYSPIGTGVACVFDNAGGSINDEVTCAAHGLENGDKIVFKAGGGALPSGLNDYTVYHVVTKAVGYFCVALTNGGAAVDIVDDGGACFWYPINTTTGVQKNTQTLLTETIMARAAAADSFPVEIKSPRIPCNYRLMCRGWAAGGTNAISFFIVLHTYSS